MNRVEKLNKTYLKAFNDIFLYDFIPDEDYRLLVTFLKISADLKHIKCYFKVIGKNNQEEVEDIKKYLKNHRGVIRHYLSKRIHSKYTPEIIFFSDSFEYDYDD